MPDPYFVGVGLHEIKAGGFLDIHADFNKHSKTNLDRRLNLIIYLNQNWSNENGGNLEFWDKKMANCEKEVAPLFNTLVVFSTTSDSYHGHPHPVTCKEHESRKSIALYYYTNGRPAHKLNPENLSHSTLYVKKGLKDPLTAKKIIKALTPPVLFNLIKPK